MNVTPCARGLLVSTKGQRRRGGYEVAGAPLLNDACTHGALTPSRVTQAQFRGGHRALLEAAFGRP